METKVLEKSTFLATLVNGTSRRHMGSGKEGCHSVVVDDEDDRAYICGNKTPYRQLKSKDGKERVLANDDECITFVEIDVFDDAAKVRALKLLMSAGFELEASVIKFLDPEFGIGEKGDLEAVVI